MTLSSDDDKLTCDSSGSSGSLESKVSKYGLVVRDDSGDVVRSGIEWISPNVLSACDNKKDISDHLLPDDCSPELSSKIDPSLIQPVKRSSSIKDVLVFNAEYFAAAFSGIVVGRLAVEHVHADFLSPGAVLFMGDTLGFYAVNVGLRYLEKAKQYSNRDNSFFKDLYKIAVIGTVAGVAATACRVGITDYLSAQGWDPLAASDIAQIPAQLLSITGFNVGWFYGERVTNYLKSAIAGAALYISEKMDKRPDV